MSQTKRAWKLQEFVAHSANIQCLAMGHKSGRVMVTGGEDRKVNLWALGKPHCIMSLTGHTTSVEAVRFGHEEEMVVAGSLSGALKVWDLEQAKIMRTLTGHKSGISSLDFHPYGDYTASGSLDSNIKLWDIRRKGCIYTYTGHSDKVNCLRFSPDGKWIASAGQDGLIKIWDLTAGKQLMDLRQHKGAVNTVEFHPNELLLASGSADRTIKFWDLESFQVVSTTDPEATPIKSLLFHPDGLCVYSGCKDMLKAYSWEPATCYDSVPIAWGDVAEITMGQDQLIGSSFAQTNVSSFVIDLKRVQPVGGTSEKGSGLSSGRKSFITERPPTATSRNSSVPKEDASERNDDQGRGDGDDTQSATDIQNQADYREHFQSNARLVSPSKHNWQIRKKSSEPQFNLTWQLAKKSSAFSPPKRMEPFQPPPDDFTEPERTSDRRSNTSADRKTHKIVHSPPRKAERDPPRRVERSPPQESPRRIERSPPRDPPQRRIERSPPRDSPRRTERSPPREAPRGRDHSPPRRKDPSPPRRDQATRNISPAHKENSGIAAEDFLSKADYDRGGNSSNMSESEVLSSIQKGHDAMMKVMTSRGRNLQIVRAMWTSGNTKTAIDSALSMKDPAVMIDILNVLNTKTSLWNLDLCSTLLPHLKDMLNSKYESYVLTTATSIKMILRNMGPVIKANMTAPPSIGVDISREERHQKCHTCYMALMDIRLLLEKRQGLAGKLGSTFKQVMLLMGTLD
ncbi:katanin p80 WD40 repeat-containing subunit B1-like isoform X2 [Haliotis rufescens]|uniref:katanin p80 WD40 repeat-containing subunit B1-like isoform X2 n=1 Tax=Haliotis rufescens TaxID=6454 RepID=UPI00201E9737|nr:katanin p80 WD40 repeat-containing subunit B1-like isoform X2 [Haliotis rufescens]